MRRIMETEAQIAALNLLVSLEFFVNSLERSNRLAEYEPDVERIRAQMNALESVMELKLACREHHKQS